MTTLTTKAGTVASVHTKPIDRHLLNISITTTPYESPQGRYQSMKDRYNQLQQQDELSSTDLASFQLIVRMLSSDSEKYEEGLFKLRKLKKKLNAASSQSSPQQGGTVEDLLIEQKHINFINVGKEGRRWIVKRLADDQITAASKEEIDRLVNVKIAELNEHINRLKSQSNLEDIIMKLAELDITFDHPMFEKKIAQQWLHTDFAQIRTLTDISRQVRSIEKQLEQQGMVDTTFDEATMEQFHN